ncbi:hypothetical protein C8F04DRAFT_1120026 [Mycena alexandri]|uniref:Uncharacterized protein n=1 Tax=Mycena alexandri TaxID=1745969 RepID=A0AAD6SJS5_9AGAR|nr:hypothetical protein C8F04DRAFT_1120026 [Mycena alexandri]
MVKGEGSERPKGPITSHAKTNNSSSLFDSPTASSVSPSSTFSSTSTDSLRPSSSPLLGACSRAVLPSCKAAILHQACVDFARTLLAQTARQTTSATRLHWEKHAYFDSPTLGPRITRMMGRRGARSSREQRAHTRTPPPHPLPPDVAARCTLRARARGTSALLRGEENEET